MRKNKKIDRSKKLNSLHLFALILLICFGFFLRIEPVIYDTVHFSYDQGDDLVEVRRLLLEHKPSLIGRATGMQGVFMGPLWTILLAVPYALSGGNPGMNVLFFAFIGTITIYYTYMIVRKMVNKTVALISTFFVALSGNFVGAAHIVLSPLPITTLMIFYLWFLWEVAIQRNKNYFPWLGLLLGIFFQFEIAFAIFMIPATLIILVVFINKKFIFTKQALIGLLLFLLTFLPQIIFDFRHNFLMSKAIAAYLSGSNVSLGTEQTGLLQRVGYRFGSFWQDYQGSVAFSEKNNLLVWVISGLALFGWFRIKKQKNSQYLRLGLLLFFIVISLYGGLILYSGPVWGWYRAGMPIVFILFISMGWGKLIEKNLIWSCVAFLIGLLLVLGTVILQSHSFRLRTGQEAGVATLKSQKQAIDFLFLKADAVPFDLYVYTPPVYTYVWDHMLLWYAKPKYENQPVDYGYKRSPTASNDFYLLIEPDYFPTRIDGWKGNFVAFGKPESEWSLASGIKVEKWKAYHK